MSNPVDAIHLEVIKRSPQQYVHFVERYGKESLDAALKGKGIVVQVKIEPEFNFLQAFPCVHRGRRIDRTQCGWDTYLCTKKGTCGNRKDPEGKMQWCGDCSERQPAAPLINHADQPTRHLLYHIWPRKHVLGTWQRNLDQLKLRWKLFNGRRVIAIVTDADSVPAEYVQGYLHGYDCEFIVLENDSKLREVKTFYPLFERVQEFNGKNHFTFYGQAKGVTKEVNSMVSVHRWTAAMYEVLLDYWPLVEESLKTKATCGAFKKHVPGAFAGSPSTWHYSGSFCWFNNERLFSAAWRKIEQVWFGIESYPSMIFPNDQAGCLFFCRDAQFDLYKMHVWMEVEKELAVWRRNQATHLSATG